MKTHKKNSVVGTISPNILKNPKQLLNFHKKGMGIARINGSYGTKEDIQNMIDILKINLPSEVKILLDLPGNKIRICNLKKPLTLKKGQEVILKPENFTYENFHKLIKKEDILSCSDGAIKIKIVSIKNKNICCLPLVDGVIINGKGINMSNIHQGIPFVHERDIELINLAIESKIDLLGLSFVRKAEQVRRIKSQLVDKEIGIVAKIETKEAIDRLEEILGYADMIMLDRGDLESEIERSELPLIQKLVISKCREHQKPVIMASQFITSMVNGDLPRLSEISDIANAFFDGTDYVMLSEETAMGKNPLKAIDTVSNVASRVNHYFEKNIKVIILAAGFSSGFGSLTTHKNKCLLDVGGQTIIEHQLENLKRCELSEENIFIITGYKSLQLEEYIKSGGYKVNFLYNPWYLNTNILASLWMAGAHKGATLILYGDIVFDFRILADLLQRREDICLVLDKKKKFDAEDEKATIKSNRISHIGKDIDINVTDAEFIGMAKLSEAGTIIAYEEMDKIVREGDLMSFLTKAFDNLAVKGHIISYLETKGRAWSDNDTLLDLKITQNEVFPRIRRIS